MSKRYQVTLVKGRQSEKPSIRECVRVLGLRKIGQVVIKEDSPMVRGLLRKVLHLVRVVRVS